MKPPDLLARIVLPVVAVVGLRLQTALAQPLRGFADLHTHAFANLGFGGNLLFGKPSGRSLRPAPP
jgi:hypothetical protein